MTLVDKVRVGDAILLDRGGMAPIARRILVVHDDYVEIAGIIFGSTRIPREHLHPARAWVIEDDDSGA